MPTKADLHYWQQRAAWCIRTGQAPHVYDHLTPAELSAWLDALS